MKRLLSLMIALFLALGFMPSADGTGYRADAKTISSAKGETIFLYALDRDGKSVLVDILDLDELKAISHGRENGENYHISTTDNYPTTQYCEGRGITIDELLNYAEQDSSVAGEGSLHFAAGDTLAFMATDSYGNYSRSWTYEDLCKPDRFYFEGLYDTEHGWRSGWEIAGGENSKFGMSLEEYNEKYKDIDRYYEDKRLTFEGGVPMPVLLATESFSGRTTTETLSASTEPGISAQIAANGGIVAESLRDMLTDETALRLCIPMTEADLMAAHRTAYDNFKWIYNMRLSMAESSLQSLGTVEAPAASFVQNGNELTITMQCETPGASIYYSFDGAPQQLYTEPVVYDTQGADLTANPVTVYMTAVRKGFDDAGILNVKYPQSGVVFKTMYSAMTGEDLVFEAENSVSDADWNSWTSNIIGISAKVPSGSSYTALNAGEYRIDSAAKTITIDSSLTGSAGAYSFLIYAKGFSNKRLSVSLKNGAPLLKDQEANLGDPVVITFDNADYQKNIYLYITPENGEKQLISTSYVDRSVPGQVTIPAAWFSMDSCPAKEPGHYELEVMNSSYMPVSQTVALTLTAPPDDRPDLKPIAFVDVNDSDWFSEAVRWAVENSVFNGISETEFAPGVPMNRAMFATVLWRMNGSPEQTVPSAFTDVDQGTWYSDAIAWCSANGYVNGYGGGLFGLNDPITREQMATILFRYTSADPEKADLAAVRGDLSGFRDREKISDWAETAMEWATGIRMINGISADQLDPKGLTTRAQTAQMLKNYSEKTGIL